eukprot:4534203-Pyramimonas_sp.AAC.1
MEDHFICLYLFVCPRAPSKSNARSQKSFGASGPKYIVSYLDSIVALAALLGPSDPGGPCRK